MINDRLLLPSGSLTSSMENFELSSLDLTVTELEEPVHDSSVPAADLGGSSPLGKDFVLLLLSFFNTVMTSCIHFPVAFS